MNNKIKILIVAAIIIILVVISINKKNKITNIDSSKEKNIIVNNNEIVNEKNLKKNLETTYKGIEVSNVKLLKNENDIITISLDVKNTNNEEKVTNLAVVFKDSSDKECGRLGISCSSLKVNESMTIKNTCYIQNQKNVKTIAIDGTVEKLVNDKNLKK